MLWARKDARDRFGDGEGRAVRMGMRLEMDWVVLGVHDLAVGLEWPGFELRTGMGLGHLGRSVG